MPVASKTQNYLGEFVATGLKVRTYQVLGNGEGAPVGPGVEEACTGAWSRRFSPIETRLPSIFATLLLKDLGSTVLVGYSIFREAIDFAGAGAGTFIFLIALNVEVAG